jgi:hypothetical protein
MMRELREELQHETEGMSAEESRAFINGRAQRFWRERAARSLADASAVAPWRPEEPAMQKPEKSFDSVRLMRELRDQIDRDVQNMTEEQRDEYIRRRAERFWTRLAEKEQRTGVAASQRWIR